VAASGTHAYVANTGSGTVTAYSVAADGTLALVSANGVSGATGAAPADEAFTPASDFFYARNGGDHTLSIVAVAADGRLTKKSDFAGIPRSAVGLVAR
jgi:6-phosphogluconolactonase (cycloisomerase 2 family)